MMKNDPMKENVVFMQCRHPGSRHQLPKAAAAALAALPAGGLTGLDCRAEGRGKKGRRGGARW